MKVVNRLWNFEITQILKLGFILLKHVLFQEDTGEVCEEVGQGNTEEDDDDDEGIERIEFVQEMEVEGDDESDDDERTERSEEGEVGRNIEYRGVMIEDEEEEDMEEEYIEIKSSKLNGGGHKSYYSPENLNSGQT